MEWMSVKDNPPPHEEPIVYCRRKNEKTWCVGIACCSATGGIPEAEGVRATDIVGFTHWIPLPKNPPKGD
jgi:hypothetical protein